uniref:Major sperm protein n=1 Tax=Syphacia muris TaxID=451379 RepID=A0A0N5A9I6_9BILA
MSKSEEVDVIVKPAEIFVVTDHPQTLSQKVTLYNLSKFKVLFQVHVSPSKRYMVSRKRGLLDAFCYVNIAVRYMPDNKDVNVRSTDKIFFEITACKDANYDSCQSKSYQTTLIHLLNSAIIFPNGLNKLSEDSSCPDSRTCHLEEPAQPLSCHVYLANLSLLLNFF